MGPHVWRKYQDRWEGFQILPPGGGMGCGLGDALWGYSVGFQELHLSLFFYLRGSHVPILTSLPYFPLVMGDECIFRAGSQSPPCVSYSTLVGWLSGGCPGTSGCLTCTQWPQLPTVSSEPDQKVWLVQNCLVDKSLLGALHVPNLSLVQMMSKHSSTSQVAQAPESNMYACGGWEVSEEETRHCVGPEQEGGPESWDHQRASWRRETQAASSGRNKFSWRGILQAQQAKTCCLGREWTLFLLKAGFLPFNSYMPILVSQVLSCHIAPGCIRPPKMDKGTKRELWVAITASQIGERHQAAVVWILGLSKASPLCTPPVKWDLWHQNRQEY